jgi:hypothetical protein
MGRRYDFMPFLGRHELKDLAFIVVTRPEPVLVALARDEARYPALGPPKHVFHRVKTKISVIQRLQVTMTTD